MTAARWHWRQEQIDWRESTKGLMTMPAQQPHDYAYIRAWSERMGSMPYYIRDQIERARATNAPPTAIYEKHQGGIGPTGEWEVWENIGYPDTKAAIQHRVDQIRGTS